MHSNPLLCDWTVTILDEGHLSIDVMDDLCLEGVEVKILGANRELLTKIKLLERHTEVDAPVGNPTFVELITPHGISVRYVKGSGSEWYSKKELFN
jgi:hypothetical protein